MALLDINGSTLANEWRDVDSWDGKVSSDAIVVSFSDFKTHALGVDANSLSRLGVRLSVEEDVAEIASYVPGLGLIELVFAQFKDGRPFSTAVKLRRDHGFAGDLRVSGDFIPDQVLFLIRCGFSSVVVPPQFDVKQVKASLSAYTVAYQSAEDQKLALVEQLRASGSASQ
ncbi:MAG: DUF934 domain-containing protein [Rhodospirillaceae bacterium]